MCAQSREGFTLIEVLVVMVLLVVGLMALVVAETQLLSAQTFNKETAMAVSLARGVIEDVRETPYEDITSENFPSSFQADFDGNELTPLLGENAVGTLQIDGPDASDVKTITVVVQWRGHGNSTRSVTLVSEVSDHL